MHDSDLDKPNDGKSGPAVLHSLAEGSGHIWQGTFEMWQNPVFGALYEKYCNQKRIFLGDLQAFISSRPLIGNLSLKIYCLPPTEPFFEIIAAAARFNVARIWIYSVNQITELQKNLEEIVHTYILDLRCESDVLWKNMESRSRNMVRKAEKNGVIIKETEDVREFNGWWKIYLNTAKTKGFSIQKYDFVSAIFKDHSLSRLFISLVDGQIAGGVLFLVNKYPLGWLNGFDRKFSKWSPNNLCIWKSMLWFKENGFPLLDLGGAVTDREHGPTQFKKSLGGRLVDAYIYNVPVPGFKNKLFNLIMRIYAKSY